MSAAGSGAPADCVVTLRRDPFRSGTARFNDLLHRRLEVPLLTLEEPWEQRYATPLLSFKPGELPGEDQAALAARVSSLPQRVRPSFFLHGWEGLGIEKVIVRAAAVNWCGNAEIRAAVEACGAEARDAWAPGLLTDARPFRPTALRVFTYGMARDIRPDLFERLRELLDATGRTYAVYSSHANHENATLEDAHELHDRLKQVFPGELYFLGSLSDRALYDQLAASDLFAAFFPRGVRANNTAVASAMEHGAVVVTNLDEHSPPALRHMENVIDVARCEALPLEPLALARISAEAMATARERDWDALVATLRGVS